MTPIQIRRSSLSMSHEWEPNGQSPSNTPNAKLQAAQMIAPFAQNPAAGVDIYELVKVLIQESSLSSSGQTIQISRDELERRLNPQPNPLMAAIAGQGGSQPLPAGFDPSAGGETNQAEPFAGGISG